MQKAERAAVKYDSPLCFFKITYIFKFGIYTRLMPLRLLEL